MKPLPELDNDKLLRLASIAERIAPDSTNSAFAAEVLAEAQRRGDPFKDFATARRQAQAISVEQIREMTHGELLDHGRCVGFQFVISPIGMLEMGTPTMSDHETIDATCRVLGEVKKRGTAFAAFLELALRAADFTTLEPRCVLWQRSGRRAKWKAVATGDTAAECIEKMNSSGRRHGDWLIQTNGVDPNEKRKVA
ncbi:MAG TPA: hypothetical protein VGL71_13545 [Urbifossiella sp.]